MPFDLEMVNVHGGHAAEFARDLIGHQNRIGLVHTRYVVHECKVLTNLIAVGCGDQRLAFRRLGGPLGQIVERHLTACGSRTGTAPDAGRSRADRIGHGTSSEITH